MHNASCQTQLLILAGSDPRQALRQSSQEATAVLAGARAQIHLPQASSRVRPPQLGAGLAAPVGVVAVAGMQGGVLQTAAADGSDERRKVCILPHGPPVL